jgi:hypothetical protein
VGVTAAEDAERAQSDERMSVTVTDVRPPPGGGEPTEHRDGEPTEHRAGEPDSPSARDDHDVPRGLRVAAAWTWRVLLLVIVGWLMLWVIAKLSLVFIPLTIALLLSAMLSPAVGALVRARMPRSLATAIVLVGGLAAVAGTLTLVVNQFVDGAAELAENATEGINQIQERLQQGTGPFRLSEEQLREINETVTGWFTDGQGSWAAGALSTASTVGHFFTRSPGSCSGCCLDGSARRSSPRPTPPGAPSSRMCGRACSSPSSMRSGSGWPW